MGTRGAWGFRTDGIDKVMYNHFDSYPAVLGANVVEAIRAVSNETIAQVARELELIDLDHQPTAEQLEIIQRLSISEMDEVYKNGQWYWLTRRAHFRPLYWFPDVEIQVQWTTYKDGKYDVEGYCISTGDRYLRWMVDGHEFLHNSLFCEFAYIMNVDIHALEIYHGVTEGPEDGEGRYVSEQIDDQKEYWGVPLVGVMPFEEVRALGEDVSSEDMSEEPKYISETGYALREWMNGRGCELSI